MGYQYFHGFFIINKYGKMISILCTLFANLYVLLMRGPHMVYMGSPYIFYIYMIVCGWFNFHGLWFNLMIKPECLINMGYQYFHGFFIINKYGKMISI